MSEFGTAFSDEAEIHVSKASVTEAFDILMHMVSGRREQFDSDERAMSNTMSAAIVDKLEIEDFEEVYSFRPLRANKGFKINGSGTMNDGDTLVVFVSEYHDDAAPVKAETSDIRNLAELGMGYATFLQQRGFLAMPEGSMDREIGERVFQQYTKAKEVRFMAMMNRSTDKHFVRGKTERHGKRQTLQIWGLEQFFDLVSDAPLSEDITLKMSEYMPAGKNLYYIDDDATPEGFEVYGTFMPAVVIKNSYRDFGPRLTRGNVRSFLINGKPTKKNGGSFKTTAVNDGISKTIRENPDRLSAYNNGLTIVAHSVVRGVENGRPVILEIVGPRIVNGGQTTASIFNSEDIHVAAATVPCKIVVVSGEGSQRTAADIAETSNRQNQVRDDDLASNDQMALDLQAISRTTPCGGRKWYFQRTKAEFINDQLMMRQIGKSAAFEMEYSPSRLLDKLVVGEVMMLWAGMPHHVSAGPAMSFSQFQKWAARTGLTMTADIYKDIVARHIVREAVNKALKSRPFENKKQTGNYVISLFARHFGHRLDHASILRRNAVSDELVAEMGALGDWVAERLREFSTSDGVMREVGQTVKREEMWTRFQNVELPFDFAGVPEVGDPE